MSRKHDSVALHPWLINCPDARSWFQHYTSACIRTLLSLAQRGLVDDMYSVAHSALHQCATSYFGAQKSAPKPIKPWTSQTTVAMSVWTLPARHQLHRFRKVLKLVNAKYIMLAWRNAIGQIAPGRVLVALRNDSCRDARKPPHSSPCGSRGQPCNVPSRTTSRPGLENLPAKRMKRQAKGDMGRVFAIAKKLKSGHDRPHRVIRDEPGGDAHWAELLHGQETRWSELANVAQRIRHTTHREETNGSAHVALYPGCFGRRNPRKATGPQRHSHFCGGKRVAKAAHEYCWHCSTPLG